VTFSLTLYAQWTATGVQYSSTGFVAPINKRAGDQHR
jgi:hypothetical protein